MLIADTRTSVPAGQRKVRRIKGSYLIIRFWSRSALKRRFGDRILSRVHSLQRLIHTLTCYDNIVHVVPRAVADRLSPDSEPASGGHDRGDNGCSEAVKMQLSRGTAVLVKSKGR